MTARLNPAIPATAARYSVPRAWAWWLLRPCGTTTAYRRHLRQGGKPCQACRDAEAAYKRFTRPRRGLINP